METACCSDSDDEISGFLLRTSETVNTAQTNQSWSKVEIGQGKCSCAFDTDVSKLFSPAIECDEDRTETKRRRLENSEVPTVEVERPLGFRGCRVSFSEESRSRASFQAMDWYYHILDRYLEAGYSNNALVSIFRSIPEDLACVLKEGLQAFQILRASKLQSLSNRKPPLDGAGGGAVYGSETGWWEQAMWEAQDDVGFIRFQWESATQVCRNSNCYLSCHRPLIPRTLAQYRRSPLARLADTHACVSFSLSSVPPCRPSLRPSVPPPPLLSLYPPPSPPPSLPSSLPSSLPPFSSLPPPSSPF